MIHKLTYRLVVMRIWLIMRKVLIFLVVAAVLGVGGWFAYQRFVVEPQTQAQTPSYETVKVERGNILSTVSATGNIEPRG